jgi:flagellar L-ring protein precursor FlgH
VLIDEYTLASANKSSQALRDNSRRSSVSAGLDGGGVVRSGAGAQYGSGNTGESRERGQTTRSDRLTAEMTVRVVAIAPNGTLQVEGRKKMLIDEHEQEVMVRGFLRPEDVSARNVVDSWRLADAEIAYTSNGKLDRPRGGLFSRLIGKLWP